MSSEPRFERLARENLLTAPTLDALRARTPVREGEPRALAPETFATLVALCERLRPPYPRPTAREIALEMDGRLADGEGDGWRYDAMPPDAEAFAQGLTALAAEGPLDDDLVRRLQKGETAADWPLPPTRFMEDVLAETTGIAYAHPAAQDAIDYDGYADGQGWSHLQIGDVREPWER